MLGWRLFWCRQNARAFGGMILAIVIWLGWLTLIEVLAQPGRLLSNVDKVKWALGIGGAVCLALFYLSQFSALWKLKKRQRTVLRGLGFPICVECEYDLKGLAADESIDKCPECGALIAEMPPVGKRKYRTCFECGYDLRENTTGTCTECGTPIEQVTA